MTRIEEVTSTDQIRIVYDGSLFECDRDIYAQECISFLENVVKEMTGYYPRTENTTGVSFSHRRDLCFDSHEPRPMHFSVGYAYYSVVGVKLLDVIIKDSEYQSLRHNEQVNIRFRLEHNCSMRTRVIDGRVVVVLEFDQDHLISAERTAKGCADDLWHQLKSVLFINTR